MSFSAIVAIGENGEMGYQGQLPWSFAEDLRYFKEKTMDSIVIMGRKTWESLGKPLPHRINIVLSSQDLDLPEGVLLFHEIQDIVNWYEFNYPDHEKPCWIIGGASIYKQFLAMGLIDELLITRIHEAFLADTYFPSFQHKYNLVNSKKSDAINRLNGDMVWLEFQECRIHTQ